MRFPRLLATLSLGTLFSLAAIPAPQAPVAYGPSNPDHACRACIEAHEDFLASDALRGRGSGTRDELLAAVYIASELHAYGIEPAAPDGTYLEIVPAPARGNRGSGGGGGAAGPGAATRRGGATRAGAAPGGRATNPNDEPSPSETFPDQTSGVGPAEKSQAAGVPPLPPYESTGADTGAAAPALPPGVNALGLPEPSPKLGTTANVIGVLHGTDPNAPVLLLSAHLDHLGIGIPANATADTDVIYNGASDDASGCTAVLEMARALALGPRPKRTVYFALFGSEEAGDIGSHYFTQHPPVPLEKMFANLEFEMIGWPDNKVPKGDLWLTGWERTNLGPTLAAHGARLAGDPHPDQNFFRRSDNIQLAQAGVVAQTVSAFGLQPMYHHPDDDLLHMDFDLLTGGIDSMIAPVRWLLNSDFIPAWNPGGKP